MYTYTMYCYTYIYIYIYTHMYSTMIINNKSQLMTTEITNFSWEGEEGVCVCVCVFYCLFISVVGSCCLS